MFTKLTRSGGHTYVQLVESFRDETGRPRQRTVSTLGRLDEAGGQVLAAARKRVNMAFSTRFLRARVLSSGNMALVA
jgi:hypothetical protein